ncbi:hypothetical protein BpHYR1_023760 [Brachionus plicatilis]|uniref:Uncharacterized protein n=1 Tax=Brachionus plicatilis TaxID=10195 RepID=A0A3M7SMT8_BRAPC|nr:hypothetical protein BpHYR1_023760 [Brachionus plicatilis]
MNLLNNCVTIESSSKFSNVAKSSTVYGECRLDFRFDLNLPCLVVTSGSLFSSSIKWSTVGLRSKSFTRHFLTKSLYSGDQSLGFLRVGAGLRGILNKARIGCSSDKGGSPSASSIAVIPSDHMSARQSYSYSICCSHAITSGAIQNGVPTDVFRRLIVVLRWALTPKSTSLMVPFSVIKILWPLTSRCITWFLCKWSRAAKILPAQSPSHCCIAQAQATADAVEIGQVGVMAQVAQNNVFLLDFFDHLVHRFHDLDRGVLATLAMPGFEHFAIGALANALQQFPLTIGRLQLVELYYLTVLGIGFIKNDAQFLFDGNFTIYYHFFFKFTSFTKKSLKYQNLQNSTKSAKKRLFLALLQLANKGFKFILKTLILNEVLNLTMQFFPHHKEFSFLK